MGSQTKRHGESEAWEAAFVKTRRSLHQRRRRLCFFDLKPEQQILDLGAGDGLDVQVMNRMGLHNVIALDISENLLRSVPGTRIIADSHRMPFSDSSIDVVLANSVLHHFEMDAVFTEIARLLKPHGLLCYMEPRPCLMRQLLDFATFSSPLNLVSSVFRARRISLAEEFDVYHRWLELYPRVPTALEQLGLRLAKQRYTLFGILAQWELAGEPINR